MPKSMTTKRTMDFDTGEWTGEHFASSKKITLNAWELVMEAVPHASFKDSDGKKLSAEKIAAAKLAYQAASQIAIDTAKAVWDSTDERVRFYVLEGINRDMGDMLNTKGDDPIPTIRTSWRDRRNGVYPAGGGGTSLSASDLMAETFAKIDGELAGLGRTAALKLFKSKTTRESYYAKVAASKGVSTDDYKTAFAAKVTASLV